MSQERTIIFSPSAVFSSKSQPTSTTLFTSLATLLHYTTLLTNPNNQLVYSHHKSNVPFDEMITRGMYLIRFKVRRWSTLF